MPSAPTLGPRDVHREKEGSHVFRKRNVPEFPVVSPNPISGFNIENLSIHTEMLLVALPYVTYGRRLQTQF